MSNILMKYRFTLALATIAVAIAVGIGAQGLYAAPAHVPHSVDPDLVAKMGWAPVTCEEFYQDDIAHGCFSGVADVGAAGAWGDFSTTSGRAKLQETLPGTTYATGAQYGYFVFWLADGCDQPVHLTGIEGNNTWPDMFGLGHRIIEDYDIEGVSGTLYVWDVGGTAIDTSLGSISGVIWTLTCCS